MNISFILLLAFLLAGTLAYSGLCSAAIGDPVPQFAISSPSFKNNGYMTSEFGCRGQNKSPALQWENPPAGTYCFSIVFRDLNVTWIHWVITDIPASYTGLPSDIPPRAVWNDGIRQDKNSWNHNGYGGPCPPKGTHQYEFEITAFDKHNKVLGNAIMVVSSDG